MATSTAQTVPGVEVYDYELATGDPSSGVTVKGKQGVKVTITLAYDKATTLAPDPTVWIAASDSVQTAVTDNNGFWHVFLVPNNRISPANTYYTVHVEGGRSYKIQVTDQGVPAPGWQSSAPGILLDIPAALGPTTSTVGAITATGLITAQAGINITAGGLSVVGGETDVGGLTVDTFVLTPAASTIVPGATSLSLRNHANNADNLLISDAGNATVRGSLTVTGGPLTVSAGGAAITGNSTVTGTLAITSTLTVTGLLTAQAGETISAGNLTITAGTLIFGAAGSQIIPGVTSLALRNNANNANNLLMTDAGLMTLRNALLIPPSAGAALPASNYGSTEVLLDKQSGASNASVTLTVPAGGPFPTLTIELTGRSDNAAAQLLNVQFNGDNAGNYDSSFFVIANVTQTNNAPSVGATSGICGALPPSGAAAGAISETLITIQNADSTTQRKVYEFATARWDSDAAAGYILVKGQGQWRNTTTATTSIKITPVAGNLVNWRAILRGKP